MNITVMVNRIERWTALQYEDSHREDGTDERVEHYEGA